MIKAIKINYFYFIFLMIYNNALGMEAFNWRDKSTQSAINQIALITEDKPFKEACFDSIFLESPEALSGRTAVKFLIRQALEQQSTWRSFPLIERNPIIFSIVARLFLEGWDEELPKNLQKAAEFSVIGYILETSSSADPAISYAAIGDTTIVRNLTIASIDSDIEDATKILHERFIRKETDK